MTREDYVLIAKAIRDVYRIAKDQDKRWGIRAVVVSLQRELATTNPRFNPDRFAEAALGSDYAELL